ncbi:PLP-dependent transferase [Hortaea werneckii]|uniref:Aminotransferase class I/classII large domain-containing protein n=1 Tax=Hortaea werneckii TaxID=91943 RepID=A0A3M7I586_HORWE|nr:PLP-dependent transferase [Hortaea werneckii]KAI6839890.1 PLP-dependent transferase [Hortaea werneckii]KAI6945235.1 PLP-dependent transferase [Hortaea werneckii]KAI6948524.1 PLP-dependent transferase [Hortaea werneckii]KAI6975779.1 PLP-dependent transferase [Hortaea werneckii]
MGNAPPPEDPAQEPINLMRGWPNPSLLPASLIRTAATTALSDPTIAHPGLLYGPDSGYEPCRSAIATWLTAFYRPNKGPIPATRICMSGGASQNLGCILSTFSDPGYTRKIWIVAPAYMLAFRVFEQDGGFAGRLRAVPEDAEGVDVEFLRGEMGKSERQAQEQGVGEPKYKPPRPWAKVYKHVIYCVPTFANPSSRTMSLRRRRELVRLAREYDALIIADDVYDFLQWPAKKPSEQSAAPGVGAWEEEEVMKTAHLPRLVDVDREIDGGTGRPGADGFGNACSNGSFSKIGGPGLRCGWVEGSERFAYGVSQTGTTCSGGAPSQLTSTYMTLLLTSGQLDKHIQNTLRPTYARRYNKLINAITAHLLPLGFQLPQPDRDIVGGYFVWLKLPGRMTATALASACKRKGVVIAPGTIFEVPGDRETAGFDGHMRLCFAWEDEGKLEEGVVRAAGVAREMQGAMGNSDGFSLVPDSVDMAGFK